MWRGGYTKWVSKAIPTPGPLPDPFRVLFEAHIVIGFAYAPLRRPVQKKQNRYDNMITEPIPTPTLPVRQFQVEKLSNLSRQQSFFSTTVSRAPEGRRVVNSNFAMVSPFRLLL
jgi:hypothetical protein